MFRIRLCLVVVVSSLEGTVVSSVRQRSCRWWVVLAAAAMVVVVVGGPSGLVEGGEDDDPFASDPLGLVAHYDLTTELGSASDVFEVWFCHISGGPYGLSQVPVEAFVPVLGRSVGGYWSQASGGVYEVGFVVGGTVRDPSGGCRSGVREQSEGGSRAALIVEFNSFVSVGGAGTGTSGRWCSDGRSTWWCEGSYPANGRDAVVQAGGGPQAVPLPSAVVHEMGHTLGFPHSFTGLLPQSHGLREYDNPMDIMSGGGSTPYSVGMIAVNRYAAGWVLPEQVHVYEGGTVEMTLNNWGEGILMLAVPSGHEGMWLSVGARVQGSFNAAPADGVEVYVVDETSSVCSGQGPCWGPRRSVTPYPTDRNDRVAHVLTPGEQITWNDVTLTVGSQTGGGFVVTVSDGTRGSGRFTDDDGNTHEDDIERIARLGITVGCSVDPPLYCPDDPVTRAEMAAFLLRAVGQPRPTPVNTGQYVDIEDDKWYTNYAYALIQMGVDTGQNSLWRPNDPLTRLEMAEWLTRMFDQINPATVPQGLFGDINPADRSVVEGLYQTGVTRGCSDTPLLYCPDESVTRAQMASFIIRALPPN